MTKSGIGGDAGVAIGSEAVVSNAGFGTAIGPGAYVGVYQGIALGSSAATREAGAEATQITYESNLAEKKTGLAWVSKLGVLSIAFEDLTSRQITGVAAGSKATDAVNVAQLLDLQEYADYKLIASQENFNSQFTVMGERVGVLETSMEALKDGFTIRPKNGYQEIRIRQGDVTMGGNRIQGVGDAVAATDAVNKRQLDNTARSLHKKINDVDKDMKAGVAMALAVASLPQAYVPGKSMLAMSAGTYQGQSGFALGLSHATENRAWIVKGSATVDTRGNFGGSLGAGYQF